MTHDCLPAAWRRAGSLLLAPSPTLASAFLVTALLAACGDDGGPLVIDEDDADGDFITNADEGFTDENVETGTVPDTDMDGLPDYLDVDSDNDGLQDGFEAGDFDLATVPLDSDGDGLKDFVDPDSDDNGIPDWREGGLAIDTDADLQPDYRDLDDDEDLLLDVEELRGLVEEDELLDTDGDGVPNYHDIDSDDDRILDGHERLGDSDGDGLADAYDLDSDNDGYLDIEEAGDADIRTIPVDTDGDTIADFVDRDSDGDGLSDAFERAYAVDGVAMPMDRLSVDTDGDGISDLIEIGAGTDVLDPSDNPEVRNDFVFLVEYEQPPEPERKTLEFGTALRFADVYFSLDETCSMFQEFDALQVSVPAIVEQLSCSTQPLGEGECVIADASGNPPDNLPLNCGTLSPDPMDPMAPPIFEEDPDLACHDDICAQRCIFDEDCGDGYLCDEEASQRICVKSCRRNGDCGSGYLCDKPVGEPDGVCREDPLITGCLENLWTGVGKWNNIDTFHNDLSLQDDPNATATAVGDAGPGGAEVPYQAPACVADGDNCINDDTKNCTDDGVGCVGFRPDAIRVLVQITDADNQCGNDPRCELFNGDYAGTELLRQGIFFVGLYGTDDNSSADPNDPEDIAREIGIASASVDEDGEPFAFPAVDAEVVTQTVNAVRRLVGGGNFRITAEIFDEDGDAGDSLQFVDRLEVNRDPARQAQCTPVLYTIDRDGDGFDDTFPRLRPGTPVCWDVVARRNDVVRPTEAPQVYRARVEVRANTSLVDERRVFFLVPPEIDVGTPE